MRAKLVDMVGNLPIFPDKFSEEEYLKNEEGNFRSVSVWRYKIVYEVFEDKIIVTNIFDGAQNPEKLKE